MPHLVSPVLHEASALPALLAAEPEDGVVCFVDRDGSRGPLSTTA